MVPSGIDHISPTTYSQGRGRNRKPSATPRNRPTQPTIAKRRGISMWMTIDPKGCKINPGRSATFPRPPQQSTGQKESKVRRERLRDLSWGCRRCERRVRDAGRRRRSGGSGVKQGWWNTKDGTNRSGSDRGTGVRTMYNRLKAGWSVGERGWGRLAEEKRLNCILKDTRG